MVYVAMANRLMSFSNMFVKINAANLALSSFLAYFLPSWNLADATE